MKVLWQEYQSQGLLIPRDLVNLRWILKGLWEHRGNVELYFKHRYCANNYRIGKLTEYFRFPDVKPVLDDLFGMKGKVLSEVEREINNG